MNNVYGQMEYCFTCGDDQLRERCSDPNWRVRYSAAVGIGLRKDPSFLPDLERMLEIEDQRPLFSQPVTKFIGTEGDTYYAEQVHEIQVLFPYPVDDETKEAWKSRGRVKQAVLFAVYEIGQAHESLLQRIYHYLSDVSQDASVKAASAKALQRAGNADSLPYLRMAEIYDEWCTRTEAQKAIGGLNYEQNT